MQSYNVSEVTWTYIRWVCANCSLVVKTAAHGEQLPGCCTRPVKMALRERFLIRASISSCCNDCTATGPDVLLHWDEEILRINPISLVLQHTNIRSAAFEIMQRDSHRMWWSIASFLVITARIWPHHYTEHYADQSQYHLYSRSITLKGHESFLQRLQNNSQKLSKMKYVDVQGLTLWGPDLHSYKKAAKVIY